jgi:hypothetical protein
VATDFDSLAAGLRAPRGSRGGEAAVELLIWHENWLRRADFTGRCVRTGTAGESWILWAAAADFAESAPRASSSELAVLNVAIALGADTFGLSGLGRIHRYKVAEAFAAALGQSLEGLIPESGHTHPDFIPGTPEDCGACAREARDEGRRQ